MPSAAVIATTLNGGTIKTLHVFVGSRDFTPDIKWDTLRIEDMASSGVGIASFRIELPMADATEIRDQSMVRVYDYDENLNLFWGHVTGRRAFKENSVYSGIEITATDGGSILDDCFISYEVRPAGESDRARIAFLWGKYAGSARKGDVAEGTER